MRRTSPVATETKTATAPTSEPNPRPVSDQNTVVKFWGVRGSIPTPGQSTVFFGGNTSCVEVRADGEIIILDAGSGIRLLGESLAAEFQGQPIEMTLLITHTHWDHIQGFPFFLPAYDARNRVHILGYEGARDGLAATLAGQMESPYFPIALKQMPGNIVIEELKEMNFKVGRGSGGRLLFPTTLGCASDTNCTPPTGPSCICRTTSPSTSIPTRRTVGRCRGTWRKISRNLFRTRMS